MISSIHNNSSQITKAPAAYHRMAKNIQNPNNVPQQSTKNITPQTQTTGSISLGKTVDFKA